MTDTNSIDTKNITIEMMAAINGEHVAVICRNYFDCQEKARSMWDKNARFGVTLHGDRIIRTPKGGSVEFVHINATSGRGVDDFDKVKISPDRLPNDRKPNSQAYSD